MPDEGSLDPKINKIHNLQFLQPFPLIAITNIDVRQLIF